MRLLGIRRAWHRTWRAGGVAVLVLAATVVLPRPPASAATGDWIDASYGAQGVTVLNSLGLGAAYAMDPADRMYAAAVDTTATRVVRLTAAGAIDPTFGGGVAQAGPTAIRRLHVDAGGIVTLLGVVSGVAGARVWRLTAAGDPDSGFGQAGSVSLLDGNVNRPIGIIDRPGGGVIVAVAGPVGSTFATSLVALTSTGALDGSWAPDSPQPGVLVIPINTQVAVADGDGVALLASAAASPSGRAVFRVTSTGAFDPGFGVDGRFDLPGTDVFSAGSLTAAGGAMFVGGTSSTAAGGGLAVLKVLPTGSLDPTFGVSGIAHGARSQCGAFGLAISIRSGQIVAGGVRNGCGSPTLIDRFSSSGVPDPSFGTAGELQFTSIAGGATGGTGGFDVRVQSTGRIVVCTQSRGHPTLFRLRDDEAPPAAGSFAPLTPARILDTRSGNGAPVGAVPAGGSIDLQVTGRAGVPSDGVGAVVLNVTVTQPGADGNVVVYPTGAEVPLASNLNFVPGQTIPNLVTVKVGIDGQVSLKNNSLGSVQLVADVAGYYRSGTATLPGMYTPLTPARILDTRTGNGAPIGPVPPGGSLDLQVTGNGGVPSDGVGAVVLNVTVTQPSSDGNVVAFPSGQPVPLASNLNFGPGQTIPNLVTVQLGSGGKVTLRNNSAAGTVHLVADVAGYYLAGTAVVPGAFVPTTPMRLLDTRSNVGSSGPIAAGGTVLVPGVLGGTVVAFPAAAVLNVTVTQPTWDGSVVAYPPNTTPPLASNLNFVPGQTIPNLVIVKTGEGGIVLLKNNSIQGTVHLVADLAGYFLS